MKNQPLFTVIIPTYNRVKIISRAVDSILSQSFENFELIIVDDGSTDNTKDLVEEYSDKRIKYFYKENGGQNSALNRGLQEASGKYIAFCDSDDAWLPLKLQKTYEKFQEDEEVAVVYCLTGINITGQVELARNDTLEGWVYKEVLDQGYLTSPTFICCKKSCFDVIGEFDLNIKNHQDDDFCFNLCKYFKVALIKEILGIYYSDVNGRISQMRKLCADGYLVLWEKHKDEVCAICGKTIMADKYMSASQKYIEVKEFQKAKETLQKAKAMSRIRVWDVFKWNLNYLRSFLQCVKSIEMLVGRVK